MKSNQAIRFAVAAVFVNETLEAGPGRMCRIRTRVVYEACAEWCREHRLPVPTIREVANAVRSIGGTAAKTKGQRIWRGVRWQTEQDVLDMRVIADREVLQRLSCVEPRIPLEVFCKLAQIGRRTFYDMRHRGVAPNIHKVSGRSVILATDALEWCRLNGRNVTLLAMAEWLEVEFERPSAKVVKAISCGAADKKLVRETFENRTLTA